MKKLLGIILFFFASFGTFYAYGSITGTDRGEDISDKDDIIDNDIVFDLDPFVISVIIDGRLERTLNIAVRVIIPERLESDFAKNILAVRNIINRDFYVYFPSHIKESPLVTDLEPAKEKVLRSLQKELNLSYVKEVLVRYFYAR